MQQAQTPVLLHRGGEPGNEEATRENVSVQFANCTAGVIIKSSAFFLFQNIAQLKQYLLFCLRSFLSQKYLYERTS